MQNEILKKLSRKMVADPTDYMSSFRKNLQTYIDEKSISLHTISEEAGISFDTLKTLVYGDAKDCKLSTVVALARALHISVDELVGSGTISPVMCESIQITRNLPDNFVYFLRWAIRYHERALNEIQASKKAVNVMLAEFTNEGNLVMNNNFEIIDISDLPDSIRPKIFMGIKIPSDNFMPYYMEGDILLLANDRKALASEPSVVVIGGYLWIVKRKEEKDASGKTLIHYHSIRDGKFMTDADPVEEIIGYVTRVIHP